MAPPSQPPTVAKSAAGGRGLGTKETRSNDMLSLVMFQADYVRRLVELGEQDDEHVEVLGGLKPGTTYVTEQSFLIKADIEKSGASHDH